MKSHALVSPCGKFRYTLSRCWDEDLPWVTFIMLNPSTADAQEDDATIRKCIGFCRRLGFGGFWVVNLFAFRATDPKDLKRASYPVGPDNDIHLASAVALGGEVICAWGSNAKGLSRPAEVLAILKKMGRKPMALQINAGGIPAHPLMLPYTCTLIPLEKP
ncbi:hypothetical protein D9M73_94210 [compost metagenome]